MEDEKLIPKSKVIVLLTYTIIITSALTFFLISIVNKYNNKDLKLIRQAKACIEKYYYEDADYDKLLDEALKGYVSGLGDPYSRYESIQESETSSNNYAGVMNGIGVTISLNEDNYIVIDEVTKDGPAEKAGILVGDILKNVDGEDVAEAGYEKILSLIREREPGSNIRLSVLRDEKEFEINVECQMIEIITAEGELLDNGIGYIYIKKFNEKTPEQFINLLNKFSDEGAKAFIFDVRNNGGGLVSAVEKCLDPLLPEGDIAEAIYKDGTTKTIIHTESGEINLPMAVLMNGRSASGAELFSASLRDFKQVALIGENSFGKGIMQDTFRLNDGSTVVLTVAKYRTTKSECYHKVGLAPDIEVALDAESQTDNQLQRAIDYLNEKIN